MKFTAAAACEQVVWEMRFADYLRALNRSRMNKLYNGAPPYSDDEQRQNRINTNVNSLEGTKNLHDARRESDVEKRLGGPRLARFASGNPGLCSATRFGAGGFEWLRVEGRGNVRARRSLGPTVYDESRAGFDTRMGEFLLVLAGYWRFF